MNQPVANPFVQCLSALFLLTLVILSGCRMREEPAKVSTDTAALNAKLVLDFPISHAKWEVFGTPEDRGGFAHNIDNETLIAEVAPVPEHMFTTAEIGRAWIVPNAARPWLNPTFRRLLERAKNSSLDVSTQPRCRLFSSTWKNTSTPVEGMICNGGHIMLIYLTISSFT